MSQSPSTASSLEYIDRYMQGWKALNRLLHEDRSFSGRERNSAWLNTGGEKFADISAASGFDFPDDARALCLADWDFDGDVDIWLANRTAPRVRLLRNDCSDHERFVAFKLRGDGVFTSRDAFGAKLTLHLGGQAPTTLTKVLAGGDGFLSQSSRWVHFGVGRRSEIVKLVVDWPGGDVETFDGQEAGKFYLVDQDVGAKAWQPPAVKSAIEKSLPLKLQQSHPGGRILLTSRPVMPVFQFVDWKDRMMRVDFKRYGPIAINLWASWCAPCQKELALWRKHKPDFVAANLNTLALAVDGLEEADVASSTAKFDAGASEHFLPTGRATRQLMDTLDVMQRAALDRWLPLPLPCTFLINKRGELVAIYKGPVHPKLLIRDLELAQATENELLSAVAPMPGRWVHRPAGFSPLNMASLMVDAGRVEDAAAYLTDRANNLELLAASPAAEIEVADLRYTLGLLLAENGQHANAKIAFTRAARLNPQDIRAHQSLGELVAKAGDFDAAAEHYERALAIAPDSIQLHHALAMVHGAQGRHADAVDHFTKVARAHPQNPTIMFQLSTALLGAGDPKRAVAGYRKTLELQPNMPAALNNLAWLLSTSSDERIRDGEQAVTLAMRLCEMSRYEQPRPLATLAAAHAETGDFEQAVEYATKAQRLFDLEVDAEYAAATKEQLALYQQGKAFRQK